MLNPKLAKEHAFTNAQADRQPYERKNNGVITKPIIIDIIGGGLKYEFIIIYIQTKGKKDKKIKNDVGEYIFLIHAPTQ